MGAWIGVAHAAAAQQSYDAPPKRRDDARVHLHHLLAADGGLDKILDALAEVAAGGDFP